MADEKVEDGFEPEIIAFTCTWCGYPSANLAGVNKIEYPPNVKIIRVMCSGSVESGIIMDASERGAHGERGQCVSRHGILHGPSGVHDPAPR